MIRIIFDEQGDFHSDIFFKIDASPSFLQVADLYFVGDFLQEQIETKEQLMLAFINYIETRILSADKEEIFIPIDLSDQYVGGLLISKKNKELLKVKYSWTDTLHGFSISQNQVDQMMIDYNPVFKTNGEWLLSLETVIKGLDWSRRKIANTAQ